MVILPGLFAVAGCQSPAAHRQSADRAAGQIIEQKQLEALGKSEPFTIERPSNTLRKRLLQGQNLPHAGPASLGTQYLEPIEHWPESGPARPPGYESSVGPSRPEGDPPQLTLLQALQVSARNSREYQTKKEEVFRSALKLDLERDDFRNSFSGLLQGLLSADGSSGSNVSGVETTGQGAWSRRLRSGMELTSRIALDLVKLLTQDRSSSLGLFADVTISMPLLRGAGRHITAEALTQAERGVLYAMWNFERFKRTFAVRVASGYLGILQAVQEVENAEENYRGLIASGRRARRLADAGRLPEIQYDQAVQNELRARSRWIRARESYTRGLDSFKLLLGLPADADISLEQEELRRLVVSSEGRSMPAPLKRQRETPPADAPITLQEPGRENAGPLELDEAVGIRLALQNRLDLRIAQERVYDAQRAVVVAADALRAELTLLGAAEVGERRGIASAGSSDAELDFGKGRYSALLTLDLPLERTAERNSYRESFILLESTVRQVQEVEDQVKLEVRNGLRDLLESREGLRIQVQAVALARRRVRSTDLFLQAGRAQIRDLLEAQEALLNAQNAYTAALVDYRVAELELQRDLGVLHVSAAGLWREYSPQETEGG